MGTGITLIALTRFGRETNEGLRDEAGLDHQRAKPVDADPLVSLIGRPLPHSE